MSGEGRKGTKKEISFCRVLYFKRFTLYQSKLTCFKEIYQIITEFSITKTLCYD